MGARSYRELVVQQKAVDLATAVYRLTRLMPEQEEYRLPGQMIRAAASVAANIAEGNSRGSRKDYAHLIAIARGSAAELETFLIIVGRLGLAPDDQVRSILTQAKEVGRMLNALRQKLRNPAA